MFFRFLRSPANIFLLESLKHIFQKPDKVLQILQTKNLTVSSVNKMVENLCNNLLEESGTTNESSNGMNGTPVTVVEQFKSEMEILY